MKKERRILANLFKAINLISDEQLKEQLALFEVFTVANVYKEVGYNVANQLIKATHKAKEMVKKTSLEKKGEFSIEDKLKEQKMYHQEKSRKELEATLKALLKMRCKVEVPLSDEALSILMIRIAAELYAIKEELLPTQQADGIAVCYKEEIKNNTISQLLKRHMPLNQTKITAYLFAQFIALSVESVGGEMTIKDCALPSWQEPKQKEERRRTFTMLNSQYDALSKKYEDILQTLFENNQRITNRHKRISDEEEKIRSLNTAINQLEEKIQKVISEKDRMLIKTQINSYKKLIALGEEDIKSTLFIIKRYKQLGEDIAQKMQICFKQKETIEKQIQSKKEEGVIWRTKQWETYFSHFKWDGQALDVLNERFSEEEIIECERALVSLHQMDDKGAMSWGEIEDSSEGLLQHFVFSLTDESFGVCMYRLKQDETKDVEIVKLDKLV